MSKELHCKFCGIARPLINAHVIPRPFFTDQKSLGGSSKLLSNVDGEFPKRSRIGVYDGEILCAECDGAMGIWDQYGIELLLHGLADFTPVPNAEAPVAFVRPVFDYPKLKLFFLSVLWRAGESSHPFFRRVKLGPYSERIRSLLLAKSPGEPEDFDTVLSAFTVGGKLPAEGLPIADPFRERWEGVNAYRFSFGVITAYIKVDKHRFSPVLSKQCMRPGQPLNLIERDYELSSELKVICGIARENKNRSAFGSTRKGNNGVNDG